MLHEVIVVATGPDEDAGADVIVDEPTAPVVDTTEEELVATSDELGDKANELERATVEETPITADEVCTTGLEVVD